MQQKHDVQRTGPVLEWPSWATWAIVAILLSSIATVAATLNDIW
jgi:hypothetical protein